MTPSLDRLSPLLERFRVQAQLFHQGPLCGITHFDARPGRAFLHVLRRGDVEIRHPARSGLPRRQRVTEPTLIFYPQPWVHDFHNAPAEGSDFLCATVEFEGGGDHPLVRALPPLVLLPLHEVEGLSDTLNLLFREAEQVRCGQRLVANRLFEVVLMQLLRWMIQHPERLGLKIGLLCGLADPKLAPALVALHERPGAAWRVEAMAELAHLSRSAFMTRFKAVLGESPAEYLTQWRLAIARQRLRQGEAVKRISDDLGYANPSAFSRVFAQKVGASPRDWLAQQGA